MGLWRASCYPALGRYIGAEGVHFTPSRYREFGFDRTTLYPEPLDELDLRRDEIDRIIEANLAARSQVFTKAYADQLAALAKT